MSTIRLPRLVCDGCKRHTFRPDWAETCDCPREVLLSEAREAGWIRRREPVEGWARDYTRDYCPACANPAPRTVEDSYRAELALAVNRG